MGGSRKSHGFPQRGGAASRQKAVCLDTSINRVAAWVIGIRATQKALLLALLEPSKQLREAEANGNLTARLALLGEAKSLPWSAVWDEFCRRHNVPAGAAWLPEAESYVEITVRARG